MPPGWTPLKARLFGAFMALVIGGLGAAVAWLVVDACVHGRIDARHGPVLQAREPIYFAVELTIRVAAAAGLLAMGAWLAWLTAFPPEEARARRRQRRQVRR